MIKILIVKIKVERIKRTNIAAMIKMMIIFSIKIAKIKAIYCYNCKIRWLLKRRLIKGKCQVAVAEKKRKRTERRKITIKMRQREKLSISKRNQRKKNKTPFQKIKKHREKISPEIN